MTARPPGCSSIDDRSSAGPKSAGALPTSRVTAASCVAEGARARMTIAVGPAALLWSTDSVNVAGSPAVSTLLSSFPVTPDGAETESWRLSGWPDSDWVEMDTLAVAPGNTPCEAGSALIEKSLGSVARHP